MTDSRRILLVDDDPDDRLLLERVIRRAARSGGLEVETAADGAEAIARLRSRPDAYAVLITDRNMPRMSGLELLKAVKGDPASAHLPVIMVTAAAARAEILEGLDAGAYYYMAKPVDEEVLTAMVSAAMSDAERVLELQRRLAVGTRAAGLLSTGSFRFRSSDDATQLGTFLASACPDPERVVIGLTELLVNAVEHGNLEITYAEKSRLNLERRFGEEVEARLASAAYAQRSAEVAFARADDRIVVTITDQGPGFDPTPYLVFDPSRAFDNHGRGIALARALSFDKLEYRLGGRSVVGTIRL